MLGREEREIPEKTRQPAVSSGTIPSCENSSRESSPVHPRRRRNSLQLCTRHRQQIVVEVLQHETQGKLPTSSLFACMVAPCTPEQHTDRLVIRVVYSPLSSPQHAPRGYYVTDKIDVQHVYTEVTFAIGSQLIRHTLDDSGPIGDLQAKKSIECLTARLRLDRPDNIITVQMCVTCELKIGPRGRNRATNSRPPPLFPLPAAELRGQSSK
ncbi:hypothetical protein PR048_022446 [Dryococelus australis]|uniref:Uncharacterized protein n=1 Tax=Dryococelus australis TaxID=614101 RepID=A0ABQ9H112_9NEOP|nr:hypothetical protein PR048_022446 [Dryococelus australis]